MISRLEDAESDLCDDLPRLAEVVCNDARFETLCQRLAYGSLGDALEMFNDIIHDEAQRAVDDDPRYWRNVEPGELGDDEIDRAADARDRARGL